MVFWESFSNILVYIFFICIVALSAAVLSFETYVIDTAMVIGDFAPSQIGTLSVTYTLFYHFLFILAGYGLRATMDRNVLFLDVYRMGMISAFIVLIGFLISILKFFPGITLGYFYLILFDLLFDFFFFYNFEK